MIIIGGIYHELCRDPRRNELFGSGVRAAYALSNAPSPPKLRSVATTEDAALAQGQRHCFRSRRKTAPNSIHVRYSHQQAHARLS